MFCISGSAQDNELNVKSNSGFSFGLSFSPNYAYRELIVNEEIDVTSLIIETRNEREKPKIGYSTGLNLSYSLPKYIEFEIGMHYSNMGYNEIINFDDLIYPDQLDPHFGFVDASNEEVEFPKTVKINCKYLVLKKIIYLCMKNNPVIL